MGWTYDASLRDSKDQVRFLIQDVNSSKQLVQDSEINWVLNQEANVYMAAAAICDTLVARASGVKSKKIGELAISYDPTFYRGLGMQFRSRGSGHQVPFAGGISQADKAIQQGDSDATSPSVFRRLDDNPGAPQVAIVPQDPLTSI